MTIAQLVSDADFGWIDQGPNEDELQEYYEMLDSLDVDPEDASDPRDEYDPHLFC